MRSRLTTDDGARAEPADTDSTELPALIAHAESLLWSGDDRGSLHLLDRAASLDVTVVDRYGLGEALLRASNCARGWDLYDLHPSRPVDRLPGVQRWDGQPCRLLVLVAEQGFGDAIQFLRFVPLVADRAQSIVLAVHDELLATVRNSSALANVTVVGKSAARTTTWPAGARWERLMSLPAKVAGLQAEPVDPYLLAPDGGDHSRLPPASSTVTVGVAWRSTVRRGFPNRSFPARMINRLSTAGPVRIVALHRNRDIAAMPPDVETVRIDNFVDTAHVISQCDYVVTADTVTAHLAPALGVPTFICLQHRPDWRWGAPGRPTRWYANAQTLFQDESQDWGPVLADVARRVSGRPDHSRKGRT